MMVRAVLASVVVVGLVMAAPARGADELDELMPGRVVTVRDGKLVRFVARPPSASTFDLPDTTNDPTVEGGQLAIFDDDPFGPSTDSYALPMAGWIGLGNPAGSTGYRYRGAGTVTDPCRVVLVKRTVVKAVCRGTGVTLATPFGGAVAIVLTVGSDSKRYCAAFGGTQTRNDMHLVRRKDAPPPTACPLDLIGTTTSTTSTTIVVEDPLRCCAFPDLALCSHGPGISCLDGTVPAEPQSACDGATGMCVATAPSPGGCCQLSSEPFFESCSGGPDASAQCPPPAVYVPDAICSRFPPFTCLVVTTTTTTSTTTTTTL